ncbi:MAG: DUF6882 domain-containing protein [Cellulosimicrobium funkei]|uniref:Uncharacterized protein n=2 Tax=Cellulosimicrobium TaxID=157920 RepID=A0AAV5PA31_CELCE|nr:MULTISPECIES: DUF6882 domain-containing protein [Cellulosimicrobium]ARK04730.1 hypothetical protein B8281_08310 [Cellulosimicrobium sp. TH-20]QDP76515.1 hypothetical protein FOG94_16625 [Cellulosimicrobium cellulans]GLY57971.1 hypothetical protein Ccel01_25730 [Cellulosimicrobium cellulans]
MTEPQTAHGTAAQDVPALQDLVDDAAFLSHEHQLHLTDLHGDDAWAADLTTGVFTFTAPDGGTATCRLQFLGTAAPGPGTWMWAWQNVNGFPDAVLTAAESTRRTGLREAAEPELPLADDLAHRLALAAKAVTGSFAHYSAPVGGGTRAWFLLDDADLALPAPSVPRVVRTLSEGLLSVTVVDHRRAVASYASARGLPAVEDGTGAVVLDVPDGTVTVRFDERGRIAGISASSGRTAAPLAAELEAAAAEPEAAASEPAAADPAASAPTAPALTVPEPPAEEPAAPEPAAAAPEPAVPEPSTAETTTPEPRRRSWFRRRG